MIIRSSLQKIGGAIADNLDLRDLNADGSYTYFNFEGRFFGQGHWQNIGLTKQDKQRPLTMRRDTSTGLVYPYHGNYTLFLRWKGVVITFATPIFAALGMLYNLIKIPVRTAQISLSIFTDYLFQGKSAPRSFKAIFLEGVYEIGDEFKCSVRDLIRTPLFTILCMAASLWTILDPLNGHKAYNALERKWNHNLPLSRLWWSVAGPMKEFNFEGFILAGCFNPRYRTDSSNQVYDVGMNQLKSHTFTKYADDYRWKFPCLCLTL